MGQARAAGHGGKSSERKVTKAAQKTDSQHPPGLSCCHRQFDAARLSLVPRRACLNLGSKTQQPDRAGARHPGPSRASSLLAHAPWQLRRTLALRIAARLGAWSGRGRVAGPGGEAKWGMAGAGASRDTLTERSKHQYLPSAHT